MWLGVCQDHGSIFAPSASPCRAMAPERASEAWILPLVYLDTVVRRIGVRGGMLTLDDQANESVESACLGKNILHRKVDTAVIRERFAIFTTVGMRIESDGWYINGTVLNKAIQQQTKRRWGIIEQNSDIMRLTLVRHWQISQLLDPLLNLHPSSRQKHPRHPIPASMILS